MHTINKEQIESTIEMLFNDAKNDHFKMMKGMAKGIFRPMQPSDFKDAYLSISKEQGAHLVDIIRVNNIKNIVEFGTSFGISTLFLAKGAKETDGSIVTTELIETKARKAMQNFEHAGVADIIEVRIGDAMQTLKNHNQPIDLLLLDGWKDLYWPLFQMLEPIFHQHTMVYVDNADMAESQSFLQVVSQKNYRIQSIFGGKAALITKS